MVVHNNKNILMVPYEDLPNEDKDVIEAVNKFVHDAMLNHNIDLLNTFHNTMKEVFLGFPLD